VTAHGCRHARRAATKTPGASVRSPNAPVGDLCHRVSDCSAFQPQQTGLSGFATLAIVTGGVTWLSELIVQLIVDDSKG
jgi:hypothetical protein